MGEYSYNKQGHIHVGPKASRHLMEIIHCSSTGRQWAAKTLATFHKCYAVAQVWKLAEEVSRQCDRCQRG